MTFYRCSLVSQTAFKILQARTKTYSIKKKSSTKQYAYNLDSLIQYKKETALVFGAEKKLTKTGKVKKSKQNSKLNDHLQVMSACSDFNAFSTQAEYGTINQHVSLDIPDVVTSHDVLLPEAIYPLQMPSDIPNKVSFIDLPLPEPVYCVHISADFENFKDKRTEELNFVYDKGPSENTSFFSNDKISSMKMLARPVVKNKIQKNLDKETSKVPDNCNKKCVCANKSITSVIPLIENHVLSVSNPKSHNGSMNKRILTDKEKINTLEDNISEKEEICIPKLAPIPAAKPGNHIAVKEFKPTLPQVDLPHALPIEPPSSYDFIFKVPLFPKIENQSWLTNNESQFKSFQNDIKLLGFRTMPSVKSILSKSMPDLNRFFLDRWREGLIKELGEEGFRQHQEATIKRGIYLHANIMEYLSGKPVNEIQIMPDNQGHWYSLQSAFKFLSNISGTEVDVHNPFLLYKGVTDCIAMYKDLLCVVDWKVSKKPRPLLKDTYDDPLQIVAYMGAINANKELVEKFGQVNNGMIVVAYPDGSPASVHVMDTATCKGYWKTWTDRLYDFFQLTYTEKIGAKAASICVSKNKMIA